MSLREIVPVIVVAGAAAFRRKIIILSICWHLLSGQRLS